MIVQTPIFYKTKAFLDDQFMRLDREKITHWFAGVTSNLTTDIDDCHSGQITIGGVEFERDTAACILELYSAVPSRHHFESFRPSRLLKNAGESLIDGILRPTSSSRLSRRSHRHAERDRRDKRDDDVEKR